MKTATGRAREDLLHRYVSPQIVNNILGDKECISLNPVKGYCNLILTFGTFPLRENLMPEETVAYLNEYFTQMVEIIFNHNGTK